MVFQNGFNTDKSAYRGLSILLGILVFGGLARGASLTLIGALLGVNSIFSGTAAIAVGIADTGSDGEDAQA